jgi:amino acid transporter
MHLSRRMPLEGGLYQWAKIGFNELTGFLVAWNLWLFAILNTSEIGLQATQYFVYIAGPRHAWIEQSRGVVMGVSAAIIGALILVTILGLGVGKWLHKAGGIMMILTFAAIVALPWLNLATGSVSSFHPLATRTPMI